MNLGVPHHPVVWTASESMRTGAYSSPMARSAADFMARTVPIFLPAIKRRTVFQARSSGGMGTPRKSSTGSGEVSPRWRKAKPRNSYASATVTASHAPILAAT